MRCLTLADALRVQGAHCHFISRAHPGHLMEVIRQRGHMANSLSAPVQKEQAAVKEIASTNQLAHAPWLCSTWQTDAQETAPVLASLKPDWLVVDHYALDKRWEEALGAYYRKLLVIDDLADRLHSSDLLLDQNLGRQPQDYASLVPERCQVLTGPSYALLRPEFSALRPYSLQRREAQPGLRQLLISMGGVDKTNATGKVLLALKACTLPADCLISVVMGLTAPWFHSVKEFAAQMPWATEVLVNVNDMAQRMADSDLAIGAAGSTSWERCCLGLPTLMVVLADNQRGIASSAEFAGAAIVLDINNGAQFAGLLKSSIASLAQNETALTSLSRAAATVTIGCGTSLIAAHMLGKHPL